MNLTEMLGSTASKWQGPKIRPRFPLRKECPQNSTSRQQGIRLEHLEDGDEVIMEGWCTIGKTARRFGFGQCRGVILIAIKSDE
jgi:fumarylacetoacetase